MAASADCKNLDSGMDLVRRCLIPTGLQGLQVADVEVEQISQEKASTNTSVWFPQSLHGFTPAESPGVGSRKAIGSEVAGMVQGGWGCYIV